MGLGSSFGISAETGNNIQTDGLVFYVDAAYKKSYPGSGTSVTDLVNGSVGTMSSVGFNSTGYFTFETNTNRIDFTANSNLNFGTGNWTFSCWVYPTAYSADGFYRRIWMLDGPTANNTDNPQHLLDTGDGSAYSWTNGNLEITGGSTSLLNNWVNVVMVRNGSTITQYIDTVADGTDTSFSIDTSNLNSGSPRFRIGSYNTGGSGDYEGNFSNMQIYNRALTTGDILQNYNASKERFGR